MGDYICCYLRVIEELLFSRTLKTWETVVKQRGILGEDGFLMKITRDRGLVFLSEFGEFIAEKRIRYGLSSIATSNGQGRLNRILIGALATKVKRLYEMRGYSTFYVVLITQ